MTYEKALMISKMTRAEEDKEIQQIKRAVELKAGKKIGSDVMVEWRTKWRQFIIDNPEADHVGNYMADGLLNTIVTKHLLKHKLISHPSKEQTKEIEDRMETESQITVEEAGFNYETLTKNEG